MRTIWSIIVDFWDCQLEAIRVFFIRLVRLRQRWYYYAGERHLDAYDEDRGDTFRDLYHCVMWHVWTDLYWWCIQNAKHARKR